MQLFAIIPQPLGILNSPTFAGLTITGNSVFGLNSSVFQPTTDSTTFFQVLDADGGTPVFNVDTTNERISIGTTGPSAKLDILSTATSVATAQKGNGFIFMNIQAVNQTHGLWFEGEIVGDIFFGKKEGTDDLVISRAGGDTTELFRFKYNGNFGIGAMSPDKKVEVDNGASSTILITGSANANLLLQDTGGGVNTKVGQLAISADLMRFRSKDDDLTTTNIDNILVMDLATGYVGVGIGPQTPLAVNGILSFPKASGNGIKVDLAAPTYGWRDLEGFEIPDPTGGDRPTLSTYSGGSIKENAFSNGDVLRIRYHIPHDYVKGTDIFSHIHWSHNGTAISGNVVFGVTSDYAKGHNQANFGTEKSISITYATTNISTTPRYRHRIEESAITNDGGSATLIDRGLLEPDGIILVTFEVTTNPTITGGSPNNVFVHRADLHYQSTNIATKDKAPDFYT